MVASEDHTQDVSDLQVGAPASQPVTRAVPEGFPIVGIGASAGGLAAFEAFFSAMPDITASGIALVLVQHLAPDHKSILTELIKRYTGMRVFEVEDGMKVERSCAYIIPPNRDLALAKGALRLSAPNAPRGQRLPIDFFFSSLAEDQHELAVGIVLSGTGGDGTLGIRAIKAQGGMVMAQNPESTEYDGMPRSAIATGLVDFVLPPAEMPEELIAHVARAADGTPRKSVPPTPQAEEELQRIFVLLRTHTGHDFSQYKQNTIRRRIERRMGVHQIELLHGYIRYLEESPTEVEALFDDLLIGVTNFFRDPEAFEALETQVITRLLTDRTPDSVIRVWVPGCSTGEEAYSIAILLRENIDALEQRFKVQVFATDIDTRAVEAARAGVYPASVAQDIPAERLDRYFTRLDEGHYRVNKSIRDLLIFSEQDLAKDPPFSKLDLISCRNLLIYMGPALQHRLIPLFHYALNRGGFLFLGLSEAIGEFGELFSVTDRAAKLYQRKDDVYGAAHPLLGYVRASAGLVKVPASRKASGEDKLPLRALTESALLEDSPVAALVNERGDVLYLHGHTGDYLELAPGEIGVNILKLAREGVRHELTTALHRAVASKERVSRPGVRVGTSGGVELVNVAVQPVVYSGLSERDPLLFLVTFEAASLAEREAADNAGVGRSGADATSEGLHIATLQQQLRAKDDYLQATQEEMQTSNEELKSSNEELQSTNEELQSTNEELETSKEELQSVNEELATVNAELQGKVSDLSRVNNDMNNLLAGTGIGTVFVDQRLRIRRFTPAVTQFINLIQTDIGRPLGHIVVNLVGYHSLLADVQGVLDTLTPTKIEVRTDSGAWFLLSIRPYRTTDNVVEGAVVTFTEVTEIKDARAALRESEVVRRQSAAVLDAQDGIIVQDLAGRILAWNPGAVRMYGWTEAEALAMNINAVIPEERRERSLAVVQRLSRSELLEPFRALRLAKDGQIVDVTLTATALLNAANAVYAVSTTERGRTHAQLSTDS